MPIKTHHPQDNNCLNCNYPFYKKEKFCPECGQKNKGRQLKLNDFIREVFAGFFSWDAKFWRTLLPLLFKPGKISKDYTEGKRVRFTNPFRFFFIISIVFFFLVKLTTKYENKSVTNNKNIYSDFEKDSISTSNISIFNKEVTNYVSFQKKHPEIEVDIALDSLNEKNTFLNRLYYKKAKTLNEFIKNGEKSTNELLKIGFSYLSSASIFLLPVFALFFKLLYIRRRFNYMNHLIFIFHIATFFFICLVFHRAVGLIPITETFLNNGYFLGIANFMVFGVYPFIAMKNFYQQSNTKTILKLLLTYIVFSILILIAISVIFILAFFMM